MSENFYVHGVRSLLVEQVLERVADSRVVLEAEGKRLTSGAWPPSLVIAYVRGRSSRPLQIDLVDGTFTLNLLAFTSQETSELALSLVAHVARLSDGRIEVESSAEGELTVEAFAREHDGRWVSEQVSRMSTSLVQMLASAEDAQLNGITGTLTLGPRTRARLPPTPEARVDAISEMLRLLNFPDESVFTATTMAVGSPTVRCASYAVELATMVRGVDALALSTSLGGEPRVVRFGALLDALGDRASPLGDDAAVLPWLSAVEMNALCDQLGAVSMREIGKLAKSPATGYSSDDLLVVRRAPLLVFALVAAADGKIEKAELMRFGKALEDAMKSAPSIGRQVIPMLTVSLPEDLAWLSGGGFDFVEALRRAVTIVRERSPSEVDAFRKMLIDIGTAVGTSSGFLGFGKKIREAEGKALMELLVILASA